MTQGRTLGVTCSAGSELDVDRVTLFQRRADSIKAGLGRGIAPCHDLVKRNRTRHRVGPNLDDTAQFGQLFTVQVTGLSGGKFGRKIPQLAQII